MYLNELTTTVYIIFQSISLGQNTKVSSENEKTDYNLVGEVTDEDEDSSRKSKSNLEVKETSEDKNMISDQLYNIPKKTRSEEKITSNKIVIPSS